jgi:hypothetical protein
MKKYPHALFLLVLTACGGAPFALGPDDGATHAATSMPDPSADADASTPIEAGAELDAGVVAVLDASLDAGPGESADASPDLDVALADALDAAADQGVDVADAGAPPEAAAGPCTPTSCAYGMVCCADPSGPTCHGVAWITCEAGTGCCTDGTTQTCQAPIGVGGPFCASRPGSVACDGPSVQCPASAPRVCTSSSQCGAGQVCSRASSPDGSVVLACQAP